MNNRNLNDCPDYLKDFLFYMETIKGRSSRTVDGYYIDLREFLRYLAIKNGIYPADAPEKDIHISSVPFELVSCVTLSEAHAFLYECMNQRNNNAKTRSRKVSALRSFYKYFTVYTNKMSINPLEHLEVPSVKKSLPKYLTLDQARNLLLNVDSSFPERDFCIITLFLNCGMRLAELVALNRYDIKYDTDSGNTSMKLLGKGNKERIVYLNGACIEAINSYLAALDSKSGEHKRIDIDALFLNKFGKRLGARSVELIVESCLKNAGLSDMGYSPHKLRHTAATLLYQHGGVDIRVLQELLGHVSLSTTEIYTHVSSEQLENASKKSPIGNITAPKKRNGSGSKTDK